ncbi:MAG: hypothetical protein IT174_04925 [Acidobacteria bacterium]|nr:hypothetical protein [Acidobacteriota bacterium]
MNLPVADNKSPDLVPEIPESVPESMAGDIELRRAAVDDAKPLAANWIANGARMLALARRVLDAGREPGYLEKIALAAARTHFHTDRRRSGVSESDAIIMIERNFQSISRALSMSDSIFAYVDGETAAKNTRGYFGSEFIVPAYAYAVSSIAFTADFPGLGPKCRAAVIIHQLAHFIDARIRDTAGAKGAAYDSLDHASALFNVHCYPNFAINVSPPFPDDRFGMMRPED